MQPVRDHVPVHVHQRLQRVPCPECMQERRIDIELRRAQRGAVRNESDFRRHRESSMDVRDGDGDVDVIHRPQGHLASRVMDDGRTLQQHGGDARLPQRADQRLTVGDEKLRLQPGEAGDLAELGQDGVIRVGSQALEVARPAAGTNRCEARSIWRTSRPCFHSLERGKGTIVRSEGGAQQELVTWGEAEVAVASGAPRPGHRSSPDGCAPPACRRRSTAERATAR